MQFIPAEQIESLLDWPGVIEALRQMFSAGCAAPVRHHHSMHVPEQTDATLLIMPAWQPGRYNGVKVVSVYPDNASRSLPSIMGSYLLMDGSSGAPLACLDAGALTARRTTAASALAAGYLSRTDSSKLLIVGSGRLAKNIGWAHRAVRPITEIRVWARNPDKAAEVAAHYRQSGLNAVVETQLASGVAWADLISCCTMSEQPLVQGAWVKPGTHIDLMGAFKPHMRETDDALIQQAAIFADTREGVLAEAGDLLIPLQNGHFKAQDIQAELAELTRGQHPGRRDNQQITLFKSVGASLEDLAAAVYCYEKSSGRTT